MLGRKKKNCRLWKGTGTVCLIKISIGLNGGDVERICKKSDASRRKNKMYEHTSSQIKGCEVKILESQPLGLIEGEQIAYLVECLLSEKGKCITGALIPMTAGTEY